MRNVMGSHSTALGLGALSLVLAGPVLAAEEPAQCETIRFAEVGWTDITATTALAR